MTDDTDDVLSDVSSASSEGVESLARKERVYLHLYEHETEVFAGLTTYHGLVRIYNSQNWTSRIFWCVVVVSCLSLFMIHSGILLWSYHQKPTLTQVNVIVSDEGILFPDVTVCNNNPVMKSKASGWNMTEEVLTYVLSAYNDHMPTSDHATISRGHAAFEQYVEEFLRNNSRLFDFVEFFDATGYDCTDMIQGCWWSGEQITDCCSLTEPVLTDVGRCIRFPNAIAKRRQWFSGSHHGLEFAVDTKNFERPKHLPAVFGDYGIRIFVHDATSYPLLRSNGISVPPGTKLYAGMDVKNVSLLPKTNWGTCEPHWDEEVHGRRLIPQEYSASHCEANCALNMWMRTCGCAPLSKRLNDSLSVCTPYQLLRCRKRFQQDPTTWQPCLCRVECKKVEYNLQTSYTHLVHSTQHEIELDRFLSTPEYIQNNHISVSIFMREISYEHHEQQKQMETADLLSNIAGSMGLFLGMSCVTLLEIFIYLFKSVYGAMNTERQRQFVKSQIEEEKERRQSMRLQEPMLAAADTGSETEGEERQKEILRALSMQSERARKQRESFKRYGKTGPFGRRRTSTIGSVYVSDRSPLNRRQSTLPPLLTKAPGISKPLTPSTAPATPSERGKNVFFAPQNRSKSPTPSPRDARRLSTCPISIITPLPATLESADDRSALRSTRPRQSAIVRRASTIPKKHLEIPLRRRISVQAQPGSLLGPRPSHARIISPAELSMNRRQSIWDVSAESARRGYIPGPTVLRRPSNILSRDGRYGVVRPRSTTYQSENRLI